MPAHAGDHGGFLRFTRGHQAFVHGFDFRVALNGRHALALIWFAFGTGVCGVVYLGQVLEVEMCVNLRGGDVGMPEQFLNGTQVGAGFKHVGGERVPQHMW